MTFEEFQATRVHHADLGKVIDDLRFDTEKPVSGFVYLGSLYIEDVGDHWPEEARAAGKHYLLIEREEWITDNVEELERRLFDFAVSAGYELSKDDRRTFLIGEYHQWLAAQGLPDLGSADEHLFDENLTQEQRDWLRDFSRRWEANEQGEG